MQALHDVVDSCLRCEETSVQEAAAATLGVFLSEYYGSPAAREVVPLVPAALAARYTGPLVGAHDARPITALPLALAALPPAVLAPQHADILRTVAGTVTATVRALARTAARPSLRRPISRFAWGIALANVAFPGPRLQADVGVRRNGVRALATLLVHAPENLAEEDRALAWSALLHGLEDYTTDNRGDIGSWTRTAAMTALVLYGQRRTLQQSCARRANLPADGVAASAVSWASGTERCRKRPRARGSVCCRGWWRTDSADWTGCARPLPRRWRRSWRCPRWPPH